MVLPMWWQRLMFIIFVMLTTAFIVYTSYNDLHKSKFSAVFYEPPKNGCSSWLGIPTRAFSPTNDTIVGHMNMMDTIATAALLPTKYILRVGRFDVLDWLEGRKRFVVDDCPIQACWLTSDNAMKVKADALLISKVNEHTVKDFLPKPAHQIWIAQHKESPMHNRIDPGALRGLVDWTATYRRSSTVYLPYGVFVRKDLVNSRWHEVALHSKRPKEGQTFLSIDYASKKTKAVAWFVSNCQDRNGRLKYVRQLSEFIAVDIYGFCGRRRCRGASCRDMLSRQYKFYLAFENSNCEEYITEKLISQGLGSDVVPIVMGARPEDYANLVPPHSYINVDDFRGPRQLAEYLHWLNKNDTAYNEYFHWKDSYVKINHRYWCRLCLLLHLNDNQRCTGFKTEPYIGSYPERWNGSCAAFQSDAGPWKTWRPSGYWAKNDTQE